MRRHAAFPSSAACLCCGIRSDAFSRRYWRKRSWVGGRRLSHWRGLIRVRGPEKVRDIHLDGFDGREPSRLAFLQRLLNTCIRQYCYNLASIRIDSAVETIGGRSVVRAKFALGNN